MRKLLLVVVAVGLGACTFPQTKMEPVGQTQMETQQQPAAPDATSAPASERSANAKH
jgi:hypothetical protein